MATEQQIADWVKTTYELCGQEVSDTALKVILHHLKPYEVKQIAAGLGECQRTVKGKLVLADILEAIQRQDGRPSPDEAWNIAYKYLTDEYSSMVVTAEIQEACGACRDLVLMAKDKVAGRMAFMAAYENMVALARKQGVEAKWQLSLGLCRSDVADVVEAAVKAGRLTRERALALLPHSPETDDYRYRLEHGRAIGIEDKREGMKQLKQIHQMLLGVVKEIPKQ